MTTSQQSGADSSGTSKLETPNSKLDTMFRPRSVAVIGASTNPSFVSSILGSLFKYGYPGRIAAVNPRYERILDAPCYPSVLDVPGDLDVAVVGVAHRLVPAVLEECAQKGVRGVCVVTSGFSEVAAEAGADRQAEIAAWAARTGIPLTGPNCLGLLNAHERFVALPPYWEAMTPGEIGLICQSGMMSGAMTLPLLTRGLGFSLVVTTGNEAAVETADVIHYLAQDDLTRVIATFTEQVKSPAKLIAACEAAAEAGKPVVMLKIGRSEGARRAARAHTGSLVGADDAIDAALRKLGVTRVGSVDELVETVALFHTPKLPRGKGLAVVSVSGGIGGLISDQAAEIGVDLPPIAEETARALVEVVPEYGSVGNPLDITGQGVFETRIFEASLKMLAQAPGIDIVAYATGWPYLLDRASAVGAALERAVDRHPETLFLAMSMGGGRQFAGRYPYEPAAEPMDRVGGVPLLQGSECVLRAIASLIRYAEFRRRRAQTETPQPSAPPGGGESLPAPRSRWESWAGVARLTPPETGQRARELLRELVSEAGGRPLTERASKALLSLYGIRTTREILARSPDDAVGAAEAIGWPVALKVESPDLLHKTDAGAVLLNVPDADALLDGYEEIVANARAAQPDAEIVGVLVQEMAPRGVETILGMTLDPQWGPVIAVGLGGTLVEVLRDRQIVLPPVAVDEAREALGSLRAAAVFAGVRGAPPADLAALADALVRFGELCQDLAGDVAEIDVNPLLVLPAGAGVLALDALIVPRSEENRRGRSRSRP